MTDAIVKFILARLDERWTAAVATAEDVGAVWTTNKVGDVTSERVVMTESIDGEEMILHMPVTELFENAQHVVLHSPARVMASVEAQRQLVRQCEQWIRDHKKPGIRYVLTVATIVLSLLAAQWNDHIDYDEDWQPL